MSKQADIENRLGADFAGLYEWIGSLETELEQCRATARNYVESKERYHWLVEGALEAIFEVDECGMIIDYNTAAARLFGYTPSEFRRMEYQQLFAQSYHVEIPEMEGTPADQNIVHQLWCLRKDSSMFPAEIHTRHQKVGKSSRLLVYVRDVSDHKQSELLLTSQNRILEFIARGQPLEQVLDAIVVLVEVCIDNASCAIHQFNASTGKLEHMRSVPMSTGFQKYFGTVLPDNRNGSIGLAALKKEIVFSNNLMADPIWQNYRKEVEELDLKSSVSIPVILSDGKLAGVLSAFNFDPEQYAMRLRKPLDVAVHLAGIAIERQRSQRELSMRQAWYKTLFESTHDAIFIFRDNICIDCNYRAIEILKSSREQIVGFTTMEYSPKKQPDGRNSRERAQELFARAADGHTCLFKWELVRRDGRHFMVDVNMQPVAVNGETFIKTTMRDLEKQPGFYRGEGNGWEMWESAFEGSIEGLVLVAPSGEILRANHAAARMVGYSADELIGKQWEAFLEDNSRVKMDTHPSDQFEARLLRQKNEGYTTVTITRNPVASAAGKENSLVVLRNIEEYQKGLNYLLDFEQRYRSVLGNVPIIMIAMDEQNRVNFCEGRGLDSFHIPPEEFLGRQGEGVFRSLTLQIGKHAGVPIMQLIPEVRNGSCFKGIVRLRDHYFETQLIPNTNREGMNKGTIIVGMDVTDRYVAEQQLERQQQLFEQLFQRSPAGIIMMDENGYVKMVNPAFQEIFGYKNAEILGKKLDGLIVPEALTDEAKRITTGSRSGITVQKESIRLHKDGHEVPLIIYGFPVKINGDRIATFGFYIDITDRKNAETELRKSLDDKGVLLAEIHHRVKNNLAIITGLFELTIQNEADEEMKKKLLDTELRLKTIALVHEKLYHTERLSSIGFDRYIRELVSGISRKMSRDNLKVRVFYELDPVDLNINQAIPAALIINELITNAYKHAFHGRNKGVIRVYMSRIRNWVTLCVRDNGTGFPFHSGRNINRMSGIKLVHTLAEQLQGHVELDIKEGTTCTVKFKLET